MDLCSYTGQGNELQSAELLKKGLPSMNQIYADLWFIEKPDAVFQPLASMSEEVALSDRAVYDVMPYGVAMLLAQMSGDTLNQSLYAATYTQKRRVAGKTTMTIQDTMPTGEW